MRFTFVRIATASVLLSAFLAATASAQRAADVKGFHFGGALSATSIEMDETSFTDDERESGLGLNLNAGYNFNRNFGLIVALTGASIDDEGTGDFRVGHADLGGRVSFPGRSAFVPYLELALTAMSADFEVQGQDVELEGGGLTLGAGLNYFFSPRVAFDASLRFTGGKFTKIQINDRDAGDVDELDVNTSRLNLGIAFYP
jgi:opacity protein-like surface antigen